MFTVGDSVPQQSRLAHTFGGLFLPGSPRSEKAVPEPLSGRRPPSCPCSEQETAVLLPSDCKWIRRVALNPGARSNRFRGGRSAEPAV